MLSHDQGVHQADRPHTITFRPLSEDDLLLVRRWLLAPHVRRWWDDAVRTPYPDAEIEHYREALRGEDPTYRYLIELDGLPTGLIQHYRIADDPEYAAALGLDEDAVGADLFIGDVDRIGHGVGPAALRAFLMEIAFPFHGLDVCVIGPSVRNTSAIRAYEKVGFTPLRDVVVPHEPDPEHLMRITRAELTVLAVEDPKSIVRRGYDLVSRAYRADDADDGIYAEWLDVLEKRVEPGSSMLDLGCGCGVPVARRLAQRYAVTGIDLSPVQIARARELVPTATFVCADMTTVGFPDESLGAVACLFALIHLPLAEQPALLRNVRRWLRPGGLLLATVGHRAWTGSEKDWLGVKGGDMWWSHADAGTYRRWLADVGLLIEVETFVPEGTGGHTFVLATR